MASNAFLQVYRTAVPAAGAAGAGGALRGESLVAGFEGASEVLDFHVGQHDELRDALWAVQELRIRLDAAAEAVAKGTAPPPRPAPHAGAAPLGPVGPAEGLTFSVAKLVDTASPFLYQNFCRTAAQRPAPFGGAALSFTRPGAAGAPPLTVLRLVFSPAAVCDYTVSLAQTRSLQLVEWVRFTALNFQAVYTEVLDSGLAGVPVTAVGSVQALPAARR